MRELSPFARIQPLRVSRPAFVKTGTTNDYKDNWTLGGTNELVIGVWVGNPRNEVMQNVSGITGAAPIWHNVLERVYQEHDTFKNIAPHDFPVPSGLVQAEVCNESGLIPTEACPADHRHSEIFLNNQAPTQFDDVWVKLKLDSTNGMLANDNCSPDVIQENVFARLPADGLLPYEKIRDWGTAHGFPLPPTENSPCTNNTTQPTGEPVVVQINRPDEGNQVSGIVNVNGKVRLSNGGSWVLEVGRGGGEWLALATGTGDAQGKLAEFDSGAFGDGELDIRLTAVNEFGQSFESKVRVYIVASAPPTDIPTQTAEPTIVFETPIPTEFPTLEPTLQPTFEPTLEPTQEPTAEPTVPATESPEPTSEPTVENPITETPTTEPTEAVAPTETPTP